MKYNVIYKNGKPERFFLMIEKPEEFNIIRPYFLATDIDHPRKGRINSMECLFSGKVWHGKQRHGYGYSSSADVYGTLFDIIFKKYGDKLSNDAIKEIRLVNTHNDRIMLSDKMLKELPVFNNEWFSEKHNLT